MFMNECVVKKTLPSGRGLKRVYTSTNNCQIKVDLSIINIIQIDLVCN